MLGLVPQSIMNWITLLLTTLMCRLRTGAANEDEAFVLLPEYDEDVYRFKRASLVMCHPEQTFFCVNASHYIPCTHVDLTDADSEQTLASASQVLHCGPRRCCEVGGDSPCTYRCEHLRPSLDYDHPNLKWTFPKIQPKARRKRKRKEFPEDMSEYVPPVKKISIKTFVFEYEDLSEEDAEEISSDGWKPSYRKNCPGMKFIAATSIPSTADYLSSSLSTFTSPTVYDDLSATFNISAFTTEHQNITIDTTKVLVSSTSTRINITITKEFTQESSTRSSIETLPNESPLTTAPPSPTTTRTSHPTSSSTTANTPNSTAKMSATPSNSSKTTQQNIPNSINMTSTPTPKKILKTSKRKTAKPTLETFTVKHDLTTLPFNYKGICPGIGDFPYFINCYRYIRCYLYLDKVKVEHKRCPSNKEFDSVLKLCVRAGQSDCIMGPSGRLKVAISTERSSRTPLTHTPSPKHITNSTTTILNMTFTTKSKMTLNTTHTTNVTMTPTRMPYTTPTKTTTMPPTTTTTMTPTTTPTLTQTTTPATVSNMTLTTTPALVSTVNPTTTLTTTLATTPTMTQIWTLATVSNQTRKMTPTSTPTLTPTTTPTPKTTTMPTTMVTTTPTMLPTTIPITTPATMPATTPTSSPTTTLAMIPTSTSATTPTTASSMTPTTTPTTAFSMTPITTPTTIPDTTSPTTPNTPPAVSTSTQKLNTVKKTHKNEDEEESSEEYEAERGVLCPGVGNYPYPLSCTRYVKCMKRNGIIKYEHRRCPLSKEFDQKKRKCVPAGKSGCKSTILGVKPLDDLE